MSEAGLGEERGSLREQIGIVGISGPTDAAARVVSGLSALRAPVDAPAGLVSSDSRRLRSRRGPRGQLSSAAQALLDGDDAGVGRAIGQVGAPGPLVARSRQEPVSAALSGRLLNAERLRSALETRGSLFQTASDGELLLHLLATSSQGTFVNRLVDALLQVEGAWSLLILGRDHLIAARDPRGFRPLVMGRVEGGVAFASETAALDRAEAAFLREVEPGEMVIVDPEGVASLFPLPRGPRRTCLLGPLQLAAPSSTMFGRAACEVRSRAGARLARIQPVQADRVVPAGPERWPAAIGYAEASGLPIRQGLIAPAGDPGAPSALTPIPAAVRGHRLVVIDGPLQTGARARALVQRLRAAGAREIHLRLTAPPLRAPCCYGVETPPRESLLAARTELEAIPEFVGADSLAWLPIERLRPAGTERSTCDACLTGAYPLPPGPSENPGQLRLFGAADPAPSGGDDAGM